MDTTRALGDTGFVLERNSILEALRSVRGNVTKAADALGVARRTLQNRMREYGISKGKSGRPKMKLRYKRRAVLYTAGLAAAGVVTAIIVKGRSTPA